MNTQIFNDWLVLIADPKNALKHPMGTSIWLDGLEEIKKLNAATFFKTKESLSKEESKALNILIEARENALPERNFWVSGHSCLMQNSAYYNYINDKKFLGMTEYNFVEDEHGEFCPWNNKSVLGKKFYSQLEGQIRIPFYTFNHENTHLFFKNAYSDIQITSGEMYELIILIEWFCISMDLILAHDLIRNNRLYALAELCRVPAQQNQNNIFNRYCTSVASINIFANKFRSVFLKNDENWEVYDLISIDTLSKHRTYAQVVQECARKNRSLMPAESARTLLYKLKTLSLSDLVQEFTGVIYA